ncbi:universal stress protein UspA [Methylobacterium sp. XJLW]|jgi:nucleotide-binding universal stress UspA family protein|uniref:UspA domain-containing protein n=1 Tax=Methylobacterium oryzae CBMB20 TaxID=693986 RepID=A0A089QCT2_9HYPH|nr:MULTISPECIES: universal stress protein [Methylobacterium]AIQ92364.1 UspA domain-containing protein [Methylobacterium oryzae CBMB20]AWV16006.1 universal stress protein UspA [Methylobacterium sp. XJLW]
MYLRCLLVPTGPGIDATRRLEAAMRLGRRLHAHIGVAFMAPGPEHVLAAMASLVPMDGTTIEAIQQSVRESAAEGKAAFEAWCGRAGVPVIAKAERLDATFATWTELSGEVEPLLTLTGRVNDLVIVDRPDPDEPFTGRALDTALFAVGRPTLVVGEHIPHDLLDHVVIAWNGSLEATRLIGQSITLLHEAARVTVVHAQTERFAEVRAADLCAYLRWHGIVAEAVSLPVEDGTPVGAAILAEAGRRNASLLAMGAYTHSRVREFLLGGVTRHVIEHAGIPVLMAH